MEITNKFTNKIDTRSLSEMTYEYIVNQIMAGELSFGDVIKIDSIAKELGISTMPVREAIKRLAFEGVVEIKPRSRCLIKAPSADSILELIQARQLVEVYAVENYLKNPDPAQISELKKISSKMEKIINSDDIQSHLNEFLSLDRDFHIHLTSLSQNRYLINFYKLINMQISMTFTYSIHDYEIDEKSAIDHLKIARFLESKSDRAITVLKEHLKYFEKKATKKMKLEANNARP